MDGFGPDALPSAVVLTLDNLGEASALERGTWSAGTPLGSDPSVTRALPWLLDQLDRHQLHATFFVEAINCELYPDAVRAIAGAVHELGHHGWSHELWRQLAPENERDALIRGVEAFEALGMRPRGFRPPGGELTESSPALLREHGFDWCSPHGRDPRIEAGLVYVPFDWELVDAYHLMGRFGALRASRGDRQAPRPPAEVAERIGRHLAAAGCRTLILHPFLMLDEAWREGVSGLLESIAELARARKTWAVCGREFADWLRALPS